MMKVHQGTVDTYLEDIIIQSTEMTADEQVSFDNTDILLILHATLM